MPPGGAIEVEVRKVRRKRTVGLKAAAQGTTLLTCWPCLGEEGLRSTMKGPVPSGGEPG